MTQHTVTLTDHEHAALIEAAQYVRKRFWGSMDRHSINSALGKLLDASGKDDR